MINSNFQEIKTSVIKDIAQLTREKYVFPEIGEKMASILLEKLEAGEYDDLTQENDLAFKLTADLRAISNDRHWSVVFDPKGAANQVDPETVSDKNRKMQYLEMIRKNNFGFERVERLKGNIGYIELLHFEPSEYAGETAVAAMNFVANCDALIFDIRNNRGGFPSMVQLITSYLVDPEPLHINTFYYRPTENTQQFWTFPHVPGKRSPDIPVYVLISNITGSGAEEFAYNLKNMERATLVGETTAGFAHPVTREVVQGNFNIRLPYGRPINPITGLNWELKGVEPHIAVPPKEALKVAHLMALEHLIAKFQDENEIFFLSWEKEIVENDYSPVILTETDLLRCAGEYGKHKFFIENGKLLYGHQDFPESFILCPLNKNRFRLDERIKFEFVLENKDKASSIKITYRDGRPEITANRTGQE